jgi:hypothetical protein
MKTTYVLVVILTLLFSIMLEAQTLVEANPYLEAPYFGILYPLPILYANASVPLKIGVLLLETDVTGVYTPQIDNVSYVLDSEEKVTLTNLTKERAFDKLDPRQKTVSFTVSSTLYNVSEGGHTLRAYSSGSDGEVLSDEVSFMVDSSYKSPQLILISPKNLTYNTNNVQLILSTNKEFKGAKYRLDYDLVGARDVAINGNTTLTNLTDGAHKIMVFADCVDEYGGETRLVQGIGFTVDTTKTGNQTRDVALASVTLIVTIAAFTLVYHKKRKR